MRVDIVDPAAYTPPYDHALCAALARAGAQVTLVTSRFGYGDVPPADGYAVDERFYRWAPGPPGSRLRRAARLAQHVPDMLRYRPRADVVHYQWLPVQPLDVRLLPRRPRVLTAHDVLPREPRPGQLRAQRRLYERMDAVVVHSQHGRGRLVADLGVAAEKVRVIPHGAFTHLDAIPPALPPELRDDGSPVVLMPGLIRHYKGLDVLYDAWDDGIGNAQLWVCGRARMPLPSPPARCHVVPRFLSDAELAGVLRRADLVVLPYREIDQSGVLFAALGLARPLLLSTAGGFPEVAALGAAETFPTGDHAALRAAIERLLADAARRDALAAGARSAAAGPLSWDAAARAHLDLYAALV